MFLIYWFPLRCLKWISNRSGLPKSTTNFWWLKILRIYQSSQHEKAFAGPVSPFRRKLQRLIGTCVFSSFLGLWRRDLQVLFAIIFIIIQYLMVVIPDKAIWQKFRFPYRENVNSNNGTCFHFI